METDGYKVVSVDCKLHQCGGDVESAGILRVSEQALLELLAAVFPRIAEDIDATTEIVLTIQVRES